MPEGRDARAVTAEQLRALFVQTPVILVGNAVGVALTAVLFWHPAGPAAVAAWVACAAVLWLGRWLHWRRFVRRQDADDETLLRWRGSWRPLVLGQGLVWSAAVWLFWGSGEPYRQLALILIVYSYCLGSVQLLSAQPRIFLAFLSTVLLPTTLRIATDDTQPWHLELAGILMLLFGITWLMGRTYGHALQQAIHLKRRTDQLAEQLRIEKAQAEAARRVAEAASQAKTQFFAAASHDLRQPLHAMGLFAEALRQRSHDPEAASLVNSINESVDALEGLFGELLDITRIDTGGVEVHPVAVPLRDLFGRLRLHFEPIAFEKGLQLVFRGERHVVQADPVVLERILRNLVSNAVRYTHDGGVLVSARSWRDAVRLQVWDSGIGIEPAVLPRIFDEFYQVQQHQAVAPHQRKGMGLGLAIVRRLARLMGTEVVVRSRIGHGTVFTLDVPLGRPARRPEPPASGAMTLPGLTLQGRSIVVVEDEPAVREGLVVLLQAWGADVLAFDSVESVEAWVASPAPSDAGDAMPAPHLLLVDYRLPGGRTGVQALALLRAHWPGRTLPAIVVTGSSYDGHEAEADAHDFHVLLKPVLPAKLRAMIGFKLGLR